MERIAAHAERAIRERLFPGCVVGVSRAGVRQVLAFGRERYEHSPPITADSVYDLASVTKSVVTATLALQLIDEGRLSLDANVAGHIPEYRAAPDARVRHLLTYTLGNRLPMSRLRSMSPERIFAAVCCEEGVVPGSAFHYSNTPAFLMGVIIERILGASLADAARERVFVPQDMASAGFTPRGAVPTEAGLRDAAHDASVRVFARAGKTVGHAGLFAHAPDLLAFLEHRMDRPDERLSTNQIPGIGSCALGWELDAPWMGAGRTSRTFGKTGFTGTSVLIEPDRKLAVVILSNRVSPGWTGDRRAMGAFRAAAHDMIRSSV